MIRTGPSSSDIYALGASNCRTKRPVRRSGFILAALSAKSVTRRWLHIFRENDANGASAKAVEACASRWCAAGRDVVIVDPDIAKDLDDELVERAG